METEIPSFFLCPISLEIMKDPVTVFTGITYDRESIEKWIFSGKNNTCPVTKQVLTPNPDLTPNHTVRRVIQQWCSLNAIERFPTPRPAVNQTQIVKLLDEAKRSAQSQMKCLKRLKSIASTSETNKRCIEASGGVEFLASIINNSNTISSSLGEEFCETTRASEEALSLLFALHVSETGLKSLLSAKYGDFFEALATVMQRGKCESRAYAVLLLNSLSEVADPIQLIRLRPVFFSELIRILRDQISSKASKASLQVMINTCQWGRNRVKAVEVGAVPLLVDLLLEASERRESELILTVLDQVCQCAEGREELLKHGAGLAVVSKKILRVSKVANERAVRVLLSISKFSATKNVVQEMLEVGVVAKLCLVLQVDGRSKTNERAKEILKSHARVWRNSSCMPMSLLSSYPAS